jgi:hypothetical protein
VRGGSLAHVPHLDSALGDLGLGGGWHGDGTGRTGGWLRVHDVCPLTMHPVVENAFPSIFQLRSGSSAPMPVQGSCVRTAMRATTA